MPVGYGPVAALSGTLSGILLSGEAFSNAFTRTSIATLELAPQDADEDGEPDESDNCPNTPNADQIDSDSDLLGDPCDPDEDGDGVAEQGTFAAASEIALTAAGATSNASADLDGDGDLDVLVASYAGDSVAWLPNTDGQGSFGPAQPIAAGADGAIAVAAADLDGDNDLDVIFASYLDGTIAWAPNTDALGSFGPVQVVTASAVGVLSVATSDLDGDGDLDLVATSVDGAVQWYENQGGTGTFGPALSVTAAAGQ